MPRTDNPVLPDEKLIAPIKKAMAQLGAKTVRERVLTDYLDGVTSIMKGFTGRV